MKKLSILLLSVLSFSFNAKAEKIKLIIDAAHGGKDAGAKAANGETESQLCLAFAEALQEHAAKNNIEVVMVRTADEYVSLEQRNTYKPEPGVKSYFVSFHMNSENTHSARGAQIIYYSKSPQAGASRRVAEKLVNGFNMINDIGTTLSDKGSALVIKNSEIPAVIIEPGYISNEQDLRKLKDKGIQQEVAMLVVKAVTE
ncbi:MAG: N-acetylmuramoyl-L-alanine amidase [Flavipsychrobacter sp.]|nr:N-acetylmuramoyl-L-alanine amidase [Flavipsychrobacter sp.]